MYIIYLPAYVRHTEKFNTIIMDTLPMPSEPADYKHSINGVNYEVTRRTFVYLHK